MIPKVCGSCEQQVLEKLASLYWAWVNADGRRRAYKQKVCSTCMVEHYAKLIAGSQDPVLLCPACGISTADDMDPIYLSYYMPGMPGGQAEMPTCGACAARVRSQALRGAQPLEDRGVGVGGPQPQQASATSVWDSLGLAPR